MAFSTAGLSERVMHASARDDDSELASSLGRICHQCLAAFLHPRGLLVGNDGQEQERSPAASGVDGIGTR
jgi:hypothetical protein